MAKINHLIFGYREIKISPEDSAGLANFLMRSGISADFLTPGCVILSESDYKRCRSVIEKLSPVSVSDCHGLYGALRSVRSKFTILSAIILSTILTVLLSNVVWDIRIDGNDKLSTQRIEEYLNDVGFSIGNLWWNIDCSEIELSVLEKYDDISWINVNRRGTVAYVTVSENENPKEESVHKPEFSNIIATRDCVIEEITVTHGTAAVKVGDAVKKGDPLIYGIITTDVESRLCRAEGTVIGRISDTVSVDISREYEKKIPSGEEIVSVDINIFNFCVNIFKIYGNYYDECDIIEEKNSLSLSAGQRLPISVNLKYVTTYSVSLEKHSDESMIKAAGERHAAQLAGVLARADLLKISTSASFSDIGYLMRSDIVYLEDVGVESEFAGGEL